MFPSDEAKSIIVVIDLISSFSPIKACLHGLSKLVLVLGLIVLTFVAILVLKGRYQKIGVARSLLCIHKSLPK